VAAFPFDEGRRRFGGGHFGGEQDARAFGHVGRGARAGRAADDPLRFRGDRAEAARVGLFDRQRFVGHGREFGRDRLGFFHRHFAGGFGAGAGARPADEFGA